MFARTGPAWALAAVAIAAVAPTATGCSDEELIGQVEAVLLVDPTSIDFDDVAIGTTKTLEVEVRNAGALAVDLQAAVDADLGGEFVLMDVPERIGAGERKTIQLAFAPTSAGLREGKLTFSSPTLDAIEVPVKGRGVLPGLISDPLVVDFGRVLLGTTATQAVSLTNQSDRPLEVIRASLSPSTSLEFGVALTRIRLEPGESTTMVATYSPAELGADEGSTSILDSGPRAMDLSITLRGQGVDSDIVVEPNALGFSGLFVGQTQTLPFYVRNIGDQPHSLTGLAFASSGGAQAGDLSLSPASTPAEIPAGGAVQVDVTWTPQSAGMIFDEVRVDASGLRQTAVVSISGVAEPEPVPRIEVSPNSLGFGQVEVGMNTSVNLQIANVGTATLTLAGAISIQPAGSPYTLQNAPAAGTSFAPTDNATFQVVFAPTAAGPVPAAEVVIGSNDPNAPTVRVPITGEGVVTAVPSIFVDPNPLAFGQVPRGVRASRTVLVRNDGSGPLTLNLVRLTDNAGSRFSVPTPPAPGTVLQPAQSLTFAVEYFDNGMVMAYAGMMEVQSNDPSRPTVQVPLTASTEPPPPAMTDINISLNWSRTNADVDLHLVRPGGSFFDSPSDCCFCNSNPDWGMATTPTDNPFLDRDDLVGPGPETINLSVAETGEYQVVVHFYDDKNAGPADVTVDVNLRGTNVATVTRNLSGGERWIAGYITWNATTQMGTFRSSILPPFPTLLLLCF